MLGAASALTALTQPVALPILLGGCTGTFLCRRAWRHGAVAAATAVVIIAPWAIRNYATLGDPILTKSALWVNIYGGFFPPSFVENVSTDIPADAPLARYYFVDKALAKRIFELRQHQTDIAMEPIYREAVLTTIGSDVGRYLEKTLIQMGLYWWVPPKDLDDQRLSFLFVRKLPVLILVPLSIVGAVVLWRRNPPLTLAVLLALGWFTLVYGLTQVHYIRYKLDIEWLQLLLAAAAVDAAGTRFALATAGRAARRLGRLGSAWIIIFGDLGRGWGRKA